MHTEDQLMKVQQVAKLLALSPRSVYNLTIPYVNIGPRSRRWRYSDIIAFANARTTTPAGDTASAG